MNAFFIKKKPDEASEHGKEAKGRKGKHDGDEKIHARKDEDEEKIPEKAQPPRRKEAEAKEGLIQNSPARAERDGDEENIQLARIHLKIFLSPAAPPYFTDVTSPLAKKSPLPSEKESTFNLLPSMRTFCPATVSRIPVSVNVSTRSTPESEMRLFLSMVSTLSSFCCIAKMYAGKGQNMQKWRRYPPFCLT